MKKLFVVLFALVVSFGVYSQDEPKAFIGIAQDIKMGFEGPHQQGGVLNPEIKLGVKFHRYRVSIKYEWLKQIDYEKITVPAIDVRLFHLWKHEVEFYTGLELSTIFRHDNFKDGKHTGVYTGPDGALSAGANADILWNFSEYFSFHYNVNAFTAEKYDNYGNLMKPWRWDTRFGIIFSFPE